MCKLPVWPLNSASTYFTGAAEDKETQLRASREGVIVIVIVKPIIIYALQIWHKMAAADEPGLFLCCCHDNHTSIWAVLWHHDDITLYSISLISCHDSG